MNNLLLFGVNEVFANLPLVVLVKHCFYALNLLREKKCYRLDLDSHLVIACAWHFCARTMCI